ncbi:MAG: GNAT family N-acetyltransferase [Lachnospiraceae bacterium]
MKVKLVLAYDKHHEVKELFQEYMEMIIQQSEDGRLCLEAQNYDHEVLELQTKYGMPDGRLYLAYFGEDVVGCVALKRNDEDYCELKRLYIKPGYRGNKFGTVLIDRIIADARKIGYKYMQLDTFPVMESAIRLYRRYGFYDIERYNDNPALTAVYMQLDL